MIDIGGGLRGCCLPARRELFYEQPACNYGDDEAATSEGRPRECSRSFWTSDHCIQVLKRDKGRGASLEGLAWCNDLIGLFGVTADIYTIARVLPTILHTLIVLAMSKGLSSRHTPDVTAGSWAEGKRSLFSTHLQ